jgi:hypothetical protein
MIKIPSEKQKENIYYISILILYLTYILTFLGVIYLNKKYIRIFNIIIQISICLLLILRFNPYNEHQITNFDKTLIISAASFLLFNLFVTEIYSAYIIKTSWYNDIKTHIMSYI